MANSSKSSVIRSITPVVALLLVLFLSGCNKDDVATTGSLDFAFSESVGSGELTMDNFLYECLAGHTYSVVTVRYYISRVMIRAKNGSTFDLADVIYRDARDGDVTAVSIPDIPNGEYTSLEFVFGLDEIMNVDGGLENTLQNINMEWPIPGDQGYHYMKFEGKYKVYHSDTINSFNLHLGATAGNQNYFHVNLPLQNMNINGDQWRLVLNMDVNEWLQNPNTYDFETFGPAIMMNQNAQEVLQENGATVFSVNSVQKIN